MKVMRKQRVVHVYVKDNNVQRDVDVSIVKTNRLVLKHNVPADVETAEKPPKVR